jgi:hypothetical protein
MSRINLNNYEAFLLDHIEGNLSEELTVELKAFAMGHPELEIDLDDKDLPVFTKEEIYPDFKNDLLKTENDLPNEDLLNYIEGNLSVTDKLDFENKLSSDAELAKDVDALKKTILSPEADQVFADKQKLKKNEDEHVLNSVVISYSEGLLSGKEKSEFEAQLSSDKKLQKELSLIQKTKLVADTSIVHPDKESLKKEEAKVIVLFNFRVVAAIAAAVLLLVGLVIIFRNGTNSPVVTPQIANKTQETRNKRQETGDKKQEITPETNNNFVADKTSLNQKTNVVKKDSSFSEKKQEVNIANNIPVNENKNNTPVEIIKPDTTALATNTTPAENKTGVIRYTNMNALAVATDEEEKPVAPEKNTFWKRAVRFAKNVNGLGLKAVKGEEKQNDNYSLSFNALNIERK